MGSAHFLPGCFGKLPVAADFLSHHSRDDSAMEFERWLQEGAGALRARSGKGAEKLLREFPPVRLLFRPGKREERLVGAMFPGQDRSGRLFPFAAFVQGPRSGPAGSASTLPGRFAPVFSEAARIRQEAWADVPQLLAAVDALGAQAPDLQEASVNLDLPAELTLGVLAAALPSGQNSGGRLAPLEGLLRLAGENPARTGPVDYGLRFPLPAPPFPSEIAACFWFEAVRRIYGPAGEPVAAFWSAPATGEEGWLDIYLRPPGALGFLHLTDAGFTSDRLFPAAEGATGTAAAGRVEAVRDQGLSLAAALDRIGRH